MNINNKKISNTSYPIYSHFIIIDLKNTILIEILELKQKKV